MILLRCSESQSGRKQARVNGETVHDIVIAVQCSECQSGEKFKTNAGKRLCCVACAVLLFCVAVLCWSAVLLCCAVECCGCVVRHAENSTLLMYMSAVTIFARFLEKNALPSMLFAFRSL